MQISEIMHEGVLSVKINDSVRRVASLMKEEDIGAVPVFEDGKAVGFVTDRDIVISCVAEGHSLDEPISNSMIEDVICIEKDKDILEASQLMKKNKVSRLLVVENDKPVGMVSLRDLAETEEEIISGET